FILSFPATPLLPSFPTRRSSDLFLTAGTSAVRAPSESMPVAILFPFDVKLMPAAIVEGHRELLLPGAGRLGLSHAADLLLQKIAEQHTVRLRPGGTFPHQLFSGLIERSRPFRQRLPLELQHHAGTGRTQLQLLVHIADQLRAAADERTDFDRNIVTQVIFKDCPLVDRKHTSSIDHL